VNDPGPGKQRLIALEPDDLEVISAHVQDAAIRPHDIHWRPAEKRVVIGLTRLDWQLLHQGGSNCRKIVAALRFDRALSCRARKIAPGADAASLNLLAVEFEPGAAPSGVVHLVFSGGASLRIEVECLECELADLASRADSAPC